MKKLTAIIMILTLTLSLCNSLSIASETQSVNDTIPLESVLETKETGENEKVEEIIDGDIIGEIDETSQKELTNEEKQQIIFDYMEDAVYEIQNCTDENVKKNKMRDVKWIAKSEHTTVNIEWFRADFFCERIFETSKELYKMITNNGVEIGRDDYISGVENSLNNGDKIYNDAGDVIDVELEQYAKLYVFGGIEKKYEFLVQNEYVSMAFDAIGNDEFTHLYYKIDNPQEIIDYLAKLDGFETIDSPRKIFSSKEDDVIIDWENKTMNKNPMKLIDTLDFEIDVTEELYHSIFQRLANVGESVKVTIKHIEGERLSVAHFRNHILIITMTGSKGEISGYCPIHEFFDSNGISLSPRYLIENDKFYSKSNQNDENWAVSFVAQGSNDNLTSVKCTLQYNPVWDSNTGARYRADCKNVNYTFYLDETEWEKNENLYFLWTTNKEEYVEEQNKIFDELQEKRKKAGIVIGDYKVLSISKTKVDVDKEFAPEWYKKLGDNVNLILYGIAKEIRRGRDCMPMLRFQGDDGMIWFSWSSMNSSEQGKRYEFKWNSLKSFDGKKEVLDENTSENLFGIMTFGDDETLDNLSLTIGAETVELIADDFDVLGKDNLYSDDLIKMVSLYDDEYWEDIDEGMNNIKYGGVTK